MEEKDLEVLFSDFIATYNDVEDIEKAKSYFPEFKDYDSNILGDFIATYNDTEDVNKALSYFEEFSDLPNNKDREELVAYIKPGQGLEELEPEVDNTELIKKKDFSSYVDKLSKISTTKAGEDLNKEWRSEAESYGTDEEDLIERFDKGLFKGSERKAKENYDLTGEINLDLLEVEKPWETNIDLASKSLLSKGEELTEENVKEEAINIYVRNKELDWKESQADEILEEFESDYGVDRFEDVGSVIETVSQFSIPGMAYKAIKGVRNLLDQELTEKEKEDKEKDYWGFIADQAYKNFGTDQQRKYYDNRNKLYQELEVKEKELDKEYRDKTSDLVSRRQDIDRSIGDINNYEKRFREEDSTLTDEDVKKYNALVAGTNQQISLLEKDIKEFSESAIASNDIETIKNLTLKTYDNLNIASNNISSAIITLGAGLSTLKHELSVPELIKWTGVDIGKDEDLDKVFGKEDSYVKEAVSYWGKFNNKVGDAINAAHEIGTSVKDKNAKLPSIGEVESLSDFGMYALDLASGQLVNTAVTIALPPVGLLALSGGAAGGKMYEMNKEIDGVKNSEGEYIVPPKDINALQYFTTAALYGGVEYATESVSLGILKGVGKNVKKAFELSGSDLTLKNLTNVESWAKFGYDFGKNSFKESGAEGIVQLTNNLADMYILGNKDVSALDGMTDAMAAGFFMGNMYQTPALVAQVSQSFSSESELAKANALNKQLVELSKQRNEILGKGGDAGAIQSRIDNILDEQMKAMNLVQQRTLDMSPSDRQAMIDQYVEEHGIRAEADRINENKDYSEDIKKDLILEQGNKLIKSKSKRSRIIANSTIIADNKRASDLARDIRIKNNTLGDVEVIIADNNEQGLSKGLEYIDKTDKISDDKKSKLKQKLKEYFSEAEKESKGDNSIINGFAFGDNIEIDGELINLPISFALSKENATVVSHELGHMTVFKAFMSNNPNAVKLVNDMVDYIGKNYKKLADEVNDIENRYKGKSEAYIAEEKLAAVSDFMRKNNIKSDKTLRNKIFGKFQKINDGKNQIENGQDVFNMVRSFNESFEKGELTGLSETVLSQADLSAVEDSDQKFSKTALSETLEEKKSRQDNRNKLLDKVYNEQALDEDGKPVSKQEFGEFLETREGKDFVAEVLMMSYNDMLAIVKGDELKVDFNPIIKHIEAFNPQKKVTEGKFDLKGYFGRFLKVKTQTGSKQVAKTDAPKGTIRIDQKREGARDIEIKDTSKTPDIDTKAELNFRNKLKIKTGGDLYNSILKKAKIILSTLPTNLTVPKTNTTLKEVKTELQENPNNNKAIGNLNKIFKDFRKTLKNAFDTQLFKEIKDSMGTREAYSEYLRSNKEAILTGLPIADLVAMQKAKGADKILVKPVKQNLSPNEIKQYEGSANLMYTSPTSGPTIYERLNTGDKEFVDFFNVRGRKDALARNIAGKLGEDATMETLASEDVMDAFVTKNPTLKQIPTDMLSNSIAQAIDSGVGLKFSKSAQKEVFKQYNSDFVKNLKEQNLGVNRKSIEAALYKTFINENPTKVWGETIEEQQKTLSKFAKDLVNPVRKYLKPEGKRSLKALKAVPDFGEFTLEEIAQKELDTNLIKILDLKKDGVKSLAEESETPENVTLMRELEADFINHLVDKYGKVKAVKIALTMLKGHNATSGKMGATNLGTLSELNDKGKKRQPRYQYFEGLEDFVNSTLNTIPGVEIKMGKTKGDSPKSFVESIVIDKKPIEPFGSRESQTSKSKEHFEETYDKREKESQEAWDVLTEYLEFMYKNGNNLSFALTMMALKSNMDTILKSSALAKYYYVGPKMSPSKLRYEHMIPTEYVALKLTQHFVGEKIDLQALKDKYNVAIIPKTMDDNINVQLQKSMPSFWNETLSETERYFNDLMLGYQNMYALEVVGGKNKGEIIGENFLELNAEVIKAKDSNIETLSNEVIKFSKNETNNEIVGYAKTVDEALAIARDPDAPVKKIRVFDFDDTLATTKSDVLFTTPDGTKGKLNAEEFAKDGAKLLEEGYVFDFSEFNKVTDGKPGPLLDIAKKIQEARGTEDVFVLTARAPEAQVAIKEFLDSVGLNIPIENITGLGNSTGAAKANWIVNKAAEGYNDFYFADDALQNVRAVSDAMSQLNVKSKTQLAKKNNIKFSKSLVKKLDWQTDEANNMVAGFRIKNKSYIVRLYPVDKKGDYRYEFELETRTGSTQAITGTGDAISVFSTVYNGLIDAIKSNPKIKRVEFSANKSEPSRVRVYTSVMGRLGKDLGWNTDIWETTDWDGGGSFDFELTKPRKKRVKAVQDVLDVVDVKSEAQKDKVRFSKTVNEDFNKIIEQKTGIASEKRYSRAKAKVRGAGKGNKKFFIPYSAEDFMGLIYPLLSKGTLGDSQMAWFKKNLLDPYARAVENLSTDRLQLMQDFKALKKALEVPKNLRKKNDTGFTNEQAVRVYLFNRMGYETPGLSKTDLQDLIDVVNSDGLLKAFADQLMNLTKGDGYAKPGQSWLAGTITTDLIDVLNTVKRKKYLEQSGFLENADLIFSEENLNKLEAAYGEKYRESMENILKRMKSGKNRLFSGNRLSNRVLDYVNGSIGTIMFLNARSAVLQTISSINFINWSFNNPIKAGKAFANQKQYWKDFMDLMNSDYLMDRRNGLKLNISESEIADAASTSKNKAKAAINYILQKGFAPTQIADSFAIASGGATFYRNRINDLIKNEGLTEAEAKEKAMLEFRQIAETSQQSSDPSKISAQQSSDLGRVVLAFANTPMQYARLQKRAAQDLINGRGDAKSHVSKIIYYGVVQNIIFNALQQSLFALGFGDDEDEMTAKELEAHEKDKNKRYYKIANGMLDSQLRGLGVAGATTSVIKNFLLDIYERSGRKRPEYVDAVYKLLQISPPISSKISKVRQAAYQFDSKKRREEIFVKGFSLDNPAYEAGAKVLSATTNIPLDRVYNKVNNIEAALAEDTETWQSVAMLAGWPEWQIKPDKKNVKSSSSSSRIKSRKMKTR